MTLSVCSGKVWIDSFFLGRREGGEGGRKASQSITMQSPAETTSHHVDFRHAEIAHHFVAAKSLTVRARLSSVPRHETVVSGAECMFNQEYLQKKGLQTRMPKSKPIQDRIAETATLMSRAQKMCARARTVEQSVASPRTVAERFGERTIGAAVHSPGRFNFTS